MPFHFGFRVFHARIVSFPLFLLLAPLLAGPLQAQAPAFGQPIPFGSVNTYFIWEASGMAASRQNPGVVWSHNDSGYAGSTFALSTNGAWLARWSIPDVAFGDFEDIAFGPGPNPAWDYIYLGDIGDNLVSRFGINIFRFPEPAVYLFQSNAPVELPLPAYEQIPLSYPDGPHNAEGMFVDPRNGDLYIFTKADTSSRVYRATRAQMESGGPITLQFLQEIPFRKVSGAAISRDGSLIALRRGGNAALWTRSAAQSVPDALSAASYALPLAVEPNGEAIGFGPSADGYFTVSEGYYQSIYFYPRVDASPNVSRVFVPPGSFWRYDDFGFGDTPGWTEIDYDDSYLFEGAAPLGYGGGEATTVSYGFPDDKVVTTYFRRSFSVGDPASVSNLALRVAFNDGIAVYLNGKEILRRNLPPQPASDALATAANSDLRQIWSSFPVDPSLLRPGSNVVAVEVHRADKTGESLIFDLQLVEAHADSPPHFTALPRLADGACTIHLTGPAGRLVHVYASSDLRNWTLAGAVVLENGEASFQDFTAEFVRFYRIE